MTAAGITGFLSFHCFNKHITRASFWMSLQAPLALDSTDSNYWDMQILGSSIDSSVDYHIHWETKCIAEFPSSETSASSRLILTTLRQPCSK
ncbi:hypothetical protein RRG08_027308 [Elysia crispata]|uniref:Uncharacterized protein n=1 Tax=Elysia crispata TaxID=231223 RepID=A0AAE1D8W3_9GAST|nr:hypothetical protein RRG08_027308 [Elysia crispata]